MEAVIRVTDRLKDSLANIFVIKDKLKVSTDKVETMLKQVARVEEILKFIQSVRKEMKELATIFNILNKEKL